MVTSTRSVREVKGCRPDTVRETVLSETEPLLLRGLVDSWPIVQAAGRSAEEATDYIREFYSGDRMTAFAGSPEIRGKVGYNDDLSAFNFERLTVSLDEIMEPIFEHFDDIEPPTYYIGSTLLDRWFPGFRDHNDLNLNDLEPLVSIWLGNKTRVSAHFDAADNVACCVAGRRRFTLFAPDQLGNLYIGPWDLTPAGQPISLVDFHDPDFEKFPNFREALKSAYEVTLEPGDALYLPSMWWHHVEGLDGLNVLVNYWWRTVPKFMGSPISVLKHALLGLRGLPPEQRAAWRHIFEYYVFSAQDDAVAHLPEDSRGILEFTDDVTARKLRADLLNSLNR